MRKACGVAGVLSAILLFSGCVSLRVGSESGAEASVGAGLVNGYVSANAIRPYDGDILTLGILPGYSATGELASVDVWPLAGVGIGLLGVRAHVLMLEAGAGVLFYHPRPWRPAAPPPPPPPPPPPSPPAE